MKLELMRTDEQFKQIQKGDLILVKWNNYFVKHTPKSKIVMFYNVFDNKESHNEIICQRKGNHYFNYLVYLQGESSAKEVYKILE
ncbi:MAG TPA: hypothetical protein VIK78_14510 [Ruminiclostridium sp.]